MSLTIPFVSNITNNEQLFIEIQGEITHTIENKFTYMFLGKLTKNSQDAYTLNIGNHQILGKRVALKNSMLICGKYKDQGQLKIKVFNIFKHKIVFTSRPTPILSSEKNISN